MRTAISRLIYLLKPSFRAGVPLALVFKLLLEDTVIAFFSPKRFCAMRAFARKFLSTPLEALASFTTPTDDIYFLDI